MCDIPQGKHCYNSKTKIKCKYYHWFNKEVNGGDIYCCVNEKFSPYFPPVRLTKNGEFSYKKRECLES